MLGPGSVVDGRYRLEAPIARGGMGEVWRARHLALGREVALKLILDAEPTGESRRRFAREARVAAQIRHRHVVDVLDFGETEGTPYLVMELLVGEGLDARLARAPAVGLSELFEWIDQALAGLSAIHAAGVVHRDLKPANLFLAHDAEGVLVKVVDFGIARPLDDAAVTLSAVAIGTPAYMSPEQLETPRAIGPAADVWAMGVIAYEALAGARPFSGSQPFETVAAILRSQRRHLGEVRPDLPRPIVEVLERALSRDPTQRPADAAQLRRELAGARASLEVRSSVPEPSAPPGPRTERVVAPTQIAPQEALPDAPRVDRRALRARRTLQAMGAASALGVLLLGGVCVVGLDSARPLPAPPPSPAASPAPATTVAAAPAEPAAVPLRVVAGPMDARELLVRWRHLVPRVRRLVRFAGTSEALVALAIDAEALRVSQDLGGTVGDRYAGPEVLTAELVRVRPRSRLLAGPSDDAEIVAIVPAGTAAVVLEGSVDGASSTRGEGQFALAVLSHRLAGWVSSGGRAFERWTACMPTADQLGDGASALVDAHVPPVSAQSDTFVLFELGAEGRVSLAQYDDRCLLEEVAVARGGVSEVSVSRTTRAPERGTLLLAVGTQTGADPDVLSWDVLRTDRAQGRFVSVWGRRTLRSGLRAARREQLIAPRVRGEEYHPVVIVRDGRETRFVWNGVGLVEEGGGGW